MGYTIEIVRGLDGFAELEHDWVPLARDASHPFAEHDWLRAWVEAFASGGALRVFTAWDGNRLAAAVPLLEVGSRLVGAANAHTPWFSVLGEPAAAAALAGRLAREPHGHLMLPEVALDDASTRVVTEALAAARTLVWSEERRHAPVIERAQLPSGYAQHLGRSRRREVQRLTRRLADIGAVIRPLERPDDLDLELGRALALEAAGWKGRRGTAILSDPTTERFYVDVARAAASRDELRLSTVTLGDRLIAFDLCLVARGRLWIPKGGIAEDYRRNGPGIVLLAAEIERALDEGLLGVELLGDADAYKLPFATGERRYGTLHGARLRAASMTRIAYRRMLRPSLRRVARAARRR